VPLLNYTTTVDPRKTLGEIERCLVAHGAKGVMIEFGAGGQPSALAFVVPTEWGDRSFRLPARVEAVERTLRDQAARGKIRAKVTAEMAARVAWRITKDWVEAQLAIVESGMVTLPEVMLPYLLVQGNRTMYEAAAEQRLGLPGPRQ
jgi:hypothetical protein